MRSIRQGRLRPAHRTEEFNPMDGIANLADVMLVFACGLIVALIAAWNLDVSVPDGIPAEIAPIGQEGGETVQDPDSLEEMGTVYMDPETGKYYIIDNGGN